MKPLADCMTDSDLFGSTFGGESFAAWRTLARILDGLPLDDDERELFTHLTGRTVAPSEPFREAYLVVGRRSGKTLFSAAVGLHAALLDYRDRMGPGETAVVALVAVDRAQAGQLMGYVRGLVEDSPLIRAEVVNETAESIEFAHRCRIEVRTASFRTVRGRSYAAVLVDEIAYLRDDQSSVPDVELIRAVRPGLANLGGRLLGFSSPHAKRGHLWAVHRDHFGHNGSRVLVVQAPTELLNPTIDRALIAQARAEDPEAARSEWAGEFRSDVAEFLSDDDVSAAVVEGRRELPYYRNRSYAGFCDPSGGRHDAMVLAIAHPEAAEEQTIPVVRVVLDRLLVVEPPFDVEEVVQRFSDLLRSFGLRTVTGDRYASEWVAQSFRNYSIRYETSDLEKSEIYRSVLPLFAQHRVELLDVPLLRTQLRLLERRPRANGRPDLIDHSPRGADDLANAVAGALLAASKKPPGRRQYGDRSRQAITDWNPLQYS